MKRLMLYILIILSILNSCISKRMVVKSSNNNSYVISSGDFYISKIDSTALYYLVYGIKNKALYKIISKKEEGLQRSFKKIREKEIYFFKLEDYFLYENSDNPISGFNSSAPCFFLDDKTEVCREANILGPYKTKNLKGLFYSP